MRILLIDDDLNLGRVIGHQLRQQGYEVDTYTNGVEALTRFKNENYALVISDIQMPEISGIDILKQIRHQNSEVVVILITAYGSVDNAVEACKLGADDYITKPFGLEQLLFVIEKALRLRKLQLENKNLKDVLTDKFHFKNMIAQSGPMQNVLRMVQKVAASPATVLIQGESGTGKELIARAIHFNSARKDKPFITVNCPSIPENLLESELFGHVKGAFTGASKDRSGKFEQADGGTLFLDEIGDLHEDLQAKLLRVLQEQEFDRVGGSKPVKVDVRILAATNRDLQELVQERRFREDLFYRLSVVPITLPPLRRRKEDIPYLIEYFLRKFSPADKKYTLNVAGMRALQTHDWPGNIRELENIIERMVTLASGEKLSMDDVPEYLFTPQRQSSGQIIQLPETGIALDDLERMAIEQTLARCEGNQSQAARLLKIPRHVLLYRIKKLGISGK